MFSLLEIFSPSKVKKPQVVWCWLCHGLCQSYFFEKNKGDKGLRGVSDVWRRVATCDDV